jgi:hypothetical protein
VIIEMEGDELPRRGGAVAAVLGVAVRRTSTISLTGMYADAGETLLVNEGSEETAPGRV